MAWKVFQVYFFNVILICFMFFTSMAYSSGTAHFKLLPNQESLSSSYVNKTIQRRDGFIWIATSEGISRFDGKNYINHKSFSDNPNSLPNPWVHDLLEDHNNQLWVATASGAARLMPDEINFEQYNFSAIKENSISGNNVSHIFEDNQNRLWFATERALSLYQPESNDFKNFNINKNNIDLNYINVLAQKEAQQLWVGTGNGLFVFDTQTTEFTAYALNSPESIPYDIMDIAQDSKGSWWIVTAYNGLLNLTTQPKEINSFHYQPDNPNSIISNGLWSVYIDKDDNVWVASWGEGISRISAIDGRIERYKHNRGDQRSIPSNLTTNIFQDVTGLFWISTYDGIALYDPSNPIENIRPVPGTDNSLSSDLVWAFQETADAIWVGTTEGINRWDKSTGLIEKYFTGSDKTNPDNFTSVWDITSANDQIFWLGTEYGLAQFNTLTKKIVYLSESTPDRALSKEEISLFSNPVWSIINNADQSIWVGSSSSNLYLVDRELNLIKDHSNLIKSTLGKFENIEFTNLIAGINQNVWLGTTTGMFYLDASNSTIMPVRSNQGKILYHKDWIYAVVKHQDNQYWISSQNQGLSLYQLNVDGSMKRLLQFDSEHLNILDGSVYNIFPINENEVWLTGRKNLYHINLDTDVFTNYGNKYFDLDLNFHENTQIFSTDKKLYFGSNRGAIRFDPQQIKKSDYQPNVYITGINSNNISLATSLVDPKINTLKQNRTSISSTTPVHLLKTHVFDYTDTTFTFQFSALDYMYADDLFYAYRIPEIDEKWIEIQNHNELILSNLNAGNYNLQIKATNADLLWSNHIAALDFTVLPKPWLTWWAKLLYIILALIIIWIILKLIRSRLLTQFALEHREFQLSQAIWGTGDELWEWDILNKKITRINNSNLDDNRHRFFDGTFKNKDLNIHPDDINKLQLKIDNILTGKNIEFDAVYRQKNRQGKWQWMQDRAKVTSWSHDKKPLTVNGISRNINTIKKKEQRSQLIASAFQSSSDGALVLDSELKIISINAAFTEITGYDERIIDNTMRRDAGHLSTKKMDSKDLLKHIKKDIKRTGSYRNEITISTIEGKTLPIDLRVNCIYNTQKIPTHYIATMTDISYRKNSERSLRKLANYDSLTGLPNRSLMMTQLNHALLQAKRDQKQMCIMFVDLDHFKNINDSLGHTIGDELLIAVAKRLKNCIRNSDSIARIGGDEFTLGILNYDTVKDLIKIAKKILKKMSKPFELENHELIITPSIGIATRNDGEDDIETMLMQADTAMYHAKKKGRNNFQFFNESMNQAVQQRVDIEMRLRKVIKYGELFLHYQPKFSMVTEGVSGFEALIRWKDSNDVFIPPDDFISIAEETGLIFSIGEFVLESACQELSRWQNSGHKDIHVAINLSAVQFMDKKLVRRVKKMINKYNIPPLSLEIEITESTLIENLEYAVNTLNELRNLGIKLSLDDFGTGFSSLNYLKQFPIHALKIDRSFIVDMVNDPRNTSMVESIISLAHNLSIEVIAEGVETTEQLEMLISFQVEEIQGFLLSKPVDSDAAADILHKGITVSTILKKQIPD